MIVRRFIVDDMNEAMVRIRYELGSKAIIISQRKVRQKGIEGLFKKKKIEVTAAVDENVKPLEQENVSKTNINNDISEMKEMLKEALNKKTPGRKKIDPLLKQIEELKNKLKSNDIPEEIIEQIIKKAETKKDNGDKKICVEDIEKIIEKTIKVQNEFDDRIQVLIGPTGVGKTTTIAKLASIYSLYKGKKVGLITLDTYRIGAVEQLKTYAEILGVPFEVIISLKDIPEVLQKMNDREIIFVDTTGRNSKNALQISEARKFIEKLNPNKIHLVISMTTKQSDIKKIIYNYKIINYNSLILTKLDETDMCGSIFNAIYHSGVPVSYISSGQNVPEDIESAEKDKLLELILGAKK